MRKDKFTNFSEHERALLFEALLHCIESNSGIGFRGHAQNRIEYMSGARGMSTMPNEDNETTNTLFQFFRELPCIYQTVLNINCFTGSMVSLIGNSSARKQSKQQINLRRHIFHFTKGMDIMAEPKDLTEEFSGGLIAVQKAYDRRRAELEESISALEKQHAEWMNLDDGEKLLRLKLVTAFKENGEVENVYSERVKLLVKDLSKEIQTNADAARERLRAVSEP